MASAPTTPIAEGPGKGKAYFERARTVADTGNHDYAIDMLIEGLIREPENMVEREFLRDVSLRRKIKGGKPSGGLMGAKAYFKGKTPKELMLNAEWLLAKDPGNINLMLTMLKYAGICLYKDIVLWLAPIILQANRTTKFPNPKLYVDIADVYEKFDEFELAGEAVRWAAQMLPSDPTLSDRIKNLATRETLKKGQYESVPDFKESLKDKQATKDLIMKESQSKTDEYKLRMIDDARAVYEKNPNDIQAINKYAKTLVDMETEEFENLAIEVLNKAYLETKTYRYKMYVGEIKIKQLRRQHRIMGEAVKANPGDEAILKEYQKLETDRLAFELEEFAERAHHYPSDGAVLFEYGYRLYRAKQFDAAISILQQAQNSPAKRAESLHLLGRSFLEQNMHQEAVDTLRRAIESYELAETGDAKSKEMHYWLARAYEMTSQKADAEKILSKILQWDINFRDARQRLTDQRKKI